MSPRVGWIAANDCAAGKALVYRTTDGGRSWRTASVRSTNCSAGSRLDLSFSDNKHGWVHDIFANGNRDPLARTNDGGRTWREVNASGPLAGTIVFTTPHNGWASRSDFGLPGQLYSTHDAGRTWQKRRLKSPIGWTGGKLFPDAPTFFGRRGVLPVDLVLGTRTAVAFYTSDDSGETWHAGAVRMTRGSGVPSRSPFVRYIATSVVSPSVWWVAAGRTRSSIAVTSDAGKSWHASTLAVGTSEISATSTQRAWLTSS